MTLLSIHNDCIRHVFIYNLRNLHPSKKFKAKATVLDFTSLLSGVDEHLMNRYSNIN